MTVPGVGIITALAFQAEIDDPLRFRKSSDVGVHILASRLNDTHRVKSTGPAVSPSAETEPYGLFSLRLP